MSGPSETAWLGLGGNIGDPRSAITAALRALDERPHVAIVAVSSLYRTPPWGKTDQPDFLNAVAAVETTLAPRDLLELCLDIERSLKRERGERWGPRVIDIDILLHGSARIDEEGLRVPHPHMIERAFVMLPLAEIAPELEIEGERAAERARGLDSSGMERLPDGHDWWKAA